jgi:7-keto-8-aminopelargonate synthetase-like enzyme
VKRDQGGADDVRAPAYLEVEMVAVDLDSRPGELARGEVGAGTGVIGGPSGPRVLLGDESLVMLCSSNYLGLADHPRVRAAASHAAAYWGGGTGASRGPAGTMTVHLELEEALAQFCGRQSALTFGSGYLAIAGVISALAGDEEIVVIDERCHPAAIDGCRIAGAEPFEYRHCDAEHLEWVIGKAGSRAGLIVTDSVFAIDGDIAPLPAIVAAGGRHGLRVIVNEAQAIGTLGPGGRGALAAEGLETEAFALVGSLGKALGSYGGFVACDAPTAHLLASSARTSRFSTALPPPSAGAALAALAVLIESPNLPTELAGVTKALRDELRGHGLAVGGAGATPIVPVWIGEEALAVDVVAQALAGGVLIEAIVPPAVPDGGSRLRLTAMATHSGDEIRFAAGVIAASVARARLTSDERVRERARAQ